MTKKIIVVKKDNGTKVPAPMFEGEPLSKEIVTLIDKANDVYDNSKDAIMAVYNQALSEKYSPREAKTICLENIKFWGKSTIYKFLPEDSKDEKAAETARGKRQSAKLTNVPELEHESEKLTEHHANGNGFELRRQRELFEQQKAKLEAEIADLKQQPKADHPPILVVAGELEFTISKAFFKMTQDAFRTCKDKIICRAKEGKVVSVYADNMETRRK